MNKYILYCIIFENNKKYYGITRRSLDQRIYEHICEARLHSRYLINKAMKKYNYQFKVKIIKRNLNEEDALRLEKYYIKKDQTQYLKGYNQTLGGDGVRSIVYTEKMRKNISKAQKKRFKRIKNKLNNKLSSKQKLFYVFKKNGKFIGAFFNQTAFAKKYRISQAHISECLRDFKKRKSVKNFIFSWKLENIPYLLQYNFKHQWNENSNTFKKKLNETQKQYKERIKRWS